MVKYCPRCGAQNDDNANFCIKCGYKFLEPQPAQSESSEKEVAPASPPAQTEQGKPMSQVSSVAVGTSTANPSKKPPSKPSNRGWKVIVTILVLLLLVTAGGMAYYASLNHGQPSSTPTSSISSTSSSSSGGTTSSGTSTSTEVSIVGNYISKDIVVSSNSSVDIVGNYDNVSITVTGQTPLYLVLTGNYVTVHVSGGIVYYSIEGNYNALFLNSTISVHQEELIGNGNNVY